MAPLALIRVRRIIPAQLWPRWFLGLVVGWLIFQEQLLLLLGAEVHIFNGMGVDGEELGGAGEGALLVPVGGDLLEGEGWLGLLFEIGGWVMEGVPGVF